MDAVADLSPKWMLLALEGAFEQKGFLGYLSQPVVGPRSALRRLGRLGKRKLDAITGHNPIRSVDSVRSLVEAGAVTPAKLNLKCGSNEQYAEALRRLRALGFAEVVDMGYAEAEITAAGVDKGSAIDRLRERLGIARQDSVMFGDSGNDLPALGRVGTFVAVENATPQVKEKAQEICPSVYEDGVAVWLERYPRQSGYAGSRAAGERGPLPLARTS